MLMMLMVVACYTICSLSDKYAVSKARFNGSEFTFFMAAATSVFMTVTLTFVDRHVVWGIPAVLFIILIAASKMLEFQMSAMVLTQMSAFELKAWLGICLFMSYFTDIFIGTSKFSIYKIIFITVTIAGLFMIAKAGGKKINYKIIILPLVVYLIAKYGYGLVITASKPYISSTMVLYFALILMSIILFPSAKPLKALKKNSKGAAVVIFTKIPNVIGLLGENAVIAVSMSDYAFIQPMILVVLFLIGLFRQKEGSRLNVVGSIVCIVGIIGFQLF